MDFNHTEDRAMLKDMVTRFLADNYALEKRNEAAESSEGFSREQWSRFAELGLIGALFSEEVGGFGGAGFDISVLFEELGRGLVVEPFLASAVLGGTMLAELGSDDQKAMIGDVISGEKLLAFAHGEPQSHYDLSHVETMARKDTGKWVLNGKKAVVLNGDSADALIVTARTAGSSWDEDGLSAFIVPANTDGLTVRGYPTIDGQHACEIDLNDVRLEESALLGKDGDAYPAIELSVARANVALTSEAIGLMEVCRDMTLDYLRTRKQFGVPIGKFQALQHRMATVLTEIEQARSAAINAAGRLDLSRREREMAVSSAKALAGRIGRLVAEEAIQMHGGIAMTWEYGLGHFAKRLIMLDHQFGDVDYHTVRFAEFSRKAT
ncbi:acyl-CoA dehydrogenase family protein [Hoeflea prorocentri]|uniref:Acyl-CoA dehydrogenase n=1 Tax=Hoeflea prorocentri TaxID=1922333 RepID=A0A9X3UHM5_9HYPH|nr:acyl-CoA dehydrogenase [Hoeflea prorocentri]MCY6380829.1 acyl-CoA dehydrogenase [Hoeflea prorocentri]MDA5398629.1 acyl-CoA dehydrogenase [Hoeflea prorocentri]